MDMYPVQARSINAALTVSRNRIRIEKNEIHPPDKANGPHWTMISRSRNGLNSPTSMAKGEAIRR